MQGTMNNVATVENIAPIAIFKIIGFKYWACKDRSNKIGNSPTIVANEVITIETTFSSQALKTAASIARPLFRLFTNLFSRTKQPLTATPEHANHPRYDMKLTSNPNNRWAMKPPAIPKGITSITRIGIAID